VLNQHDVTEVFHLAAQAIVGKANRSPLATRVISTQSNPRRGSLDTRL
jgi:GDP-D-mannose dehydratase